ncbi:MAG: class II SORL domain-containing protein [Candidatus Hodarchaeales archaeon]
MANLNELFQSADWKTEKHSPVIEITGTNPVTVEVSVGKEIAHPNTDEHHIRWIQLLFHPDGEKFPVEIGKLEFNSHGAVTTEPKGTFTVKTDKPGTLISLSFCNIHGFWKSEKKLEI